MLWVGQNVISFFTYFSSAMWTVLLIPLLIFISKKFEILDHPNQRKVHVRYVSRLGGVAIFLSVLITLFLAYFLGKRSFNFDFWKIIICGGLIAFAMGLWDDLKNISAKKKLFFQICLAFVSYFLGFRIEEAQIGLSHSIHFGIFSMPITVLWIVTVMNAFNMIDGLDGLAGGFAFLVLTTISILGFINGNPNVMILSLACAGACLGFLFFNFHPARIFMGDSGSMTLGYILSIISIETAQSDGPISVFMPLFLMAFPLIDLVTAVLRRIIHAKSNEKGITLFGLIQRTFNADGNHTHHRLLRLGLSQRNIALIIYGFTILNCVLSVVSTYFSFGVIFFLFIFYVWFTVQCIRLLDYEEFVTSTFRNQKKQFEEKQKLSTAPSLIKKVN